MSNQEVSEMRTGVDPRREYRSPRVVEYGTIDALTQTVGNDNADGVIGSANTT